MAVRLYDGDLACWGGGPWALLTPIKALRVAVGFFKNIRAQKEETKKRFIRKFSSFCTSQVLLLGIALSLLLSLSCAIFVTPVSIDLIHLCIESKLRSSSSTKSSFLHKLDQQLCSHFECGRKFFEFKFNYFDVIINSFNYTGRYSR